MAQVEPMDVDTISSDFDDKENSLHNSNVLPKTPIAEKGYEDLDDSELHMKLRYSITPANSPMSRSYTASYKGDSGPNSLNNTGVIDNNLTRSLNATVTKTDVLKAPKLPLQALPTSLYTNSDRRSCEREGNVTVTISGTDNDDNLSLPSTSSSAVQTPEATTPTKEIPKSDGSPIMRGLKSVLNMFRSSHSPIPPSEDVASHENLCHEDAGKDSSSNSLIASTPLHSTVEDNSSSKHTSEIVPNHEIPCPETPAKETAVKGSINPHLVSSTPISNSKILKDSSKRNSPLKESVVFNEDLERELQWQEETEIFFKHEKIPIHKILFQPGSSNIDSNPKLSVHNDVGKINTTVEYMDVSNADVSYKSVLEDKTLNDIDTKPVNNEMSGVESDNEFVDCETTHVQSKSYILETVQENNVSPVVFQTDNIPHEACLEEYIEHINNDEIIVDSKITELTEQSFITQTNHLVSEKPLDDLSNLPEASKLTIPNNSCKLLTEISNEAFPEVIEKTNLPSEFPINDDVVLNVGNFNDSVSPTNNSYTTETEKVNEAINLAHTIKTNNENFENDDANTAIKDYISNETGHSVATNQSIQQSVENSKTLEMIIQTNNLFHESCIETVNDIDFKNSQMPRSSPNLPFDNMIMKDEDAINLDTDDTNTTRILFKIDELLVNKIKLANLEKEMVSSNTKTPVSECKNASEVSNLNILNTGEKYLLNESRAINDTVVIKNNKNINEEANPMKMDEVSQIIEELSNKAFVPDENIDEYTMLNKTSVKDNVEIEKNDLPNIEVDKSSEFKINVDLNTLHSPDEKKIISKMESELNILDQVKNNEQAMSCSLINNCHIVSHLQNNEGPQDITMDSLEPNLDLINDQLTCEINKTDMNAEVDYNSSEKNDIDTESKLNKPIELKNDLPIDLPLDVPLPSDDDIEKDSLLDLCSIKNNNNVGIISEIETAETACVISFDSNTDSKEAIDKANSQSSQPHNDQNLNIPHSDTFDCIPDKLQTNFSSDVEMATVDSNIIQDTSFGQLSTNITSCLQNLNLESNNKELKQMPVRTSETFNNTFTSSEVVNQPEKIVDVKPTATTLPDVVQAVNNAEKGVSTQEIKTDNTNETICMEDNINAKVVDDEIVTSANNSPYVSVSDLNLNSDVPADESENLSEIQTAGSPPISPKLSRKGYNINFDEIENPFATKTNIRMSPPPEIPNRSFTPVNNSLKNIDAQRKLPNRQKSQPDGKKPGANKKRFSTSIDRAKITNNNNKTKKSSNRVDSERSKQNKIGQGKNDNLASSIEDLQKDIGPSVKSDTSKLAKTSPDLENQTVLYKSKNIISTEENLNNNPEIRNVFNIPEIDDVNFNPFATKSRICVTPPPTELKDPVNVSNNSEIETVSKNRNELETEQLNAIVCIDNNEIANVCIENSIQNEVKVSSNTNNVTFSSINTDDKDVTVREVNTEDEDTIEGPFFEAEDLVDVVKVPEIEIDKDTEQFEDLPANSNEDVDKGELFIDAEAFEFLLNQNKSNVVADSGKESLFLKFDPLFAKKVSSDGVYAALSTIQKKQSTPKKLTRAPLGKLAQDEKPSVPMAGPSNVASMPEVNNEEIINTVSKPMMVVNPAIAKQPVATPRISLTPKTNRQSLNFTSPAMVVIDRLLSLSGNTSLLDQDVTTDASRNHEANIVLVQLRELLAEKELHVHSLKCESKELRERLNTLESQVRSLENEGEERLKKVNTLNERLAEKTKINKSMAVVVEEYERTIASLIAETEQEKKRNAEERMRLINERDEQTAHLASMEGSFSDLHSKYEKCKQIILNMKANEDGYKKSFKEFDENLLKMQKNYDLLKQHATSKLNHANQELEKLNKAHDAEVLKLTAIIKRKDLHITSLEESLTQKCKANEELAAICDELINKVG